MLEVWPKSDFVLVLHLNVGTDFAVGLRPILDSLDLSEKMLQSNPGRMFINSATGYPSKILVIEFF